ncbi:M28 family peptidase [Nonomuraea sp. LPB2021202275-12-8]|uniref:M28 family peptidase n=1 Tax=Nonomuraea sp. LPB2021202275-12-8 TaxID=3120159 RepID=UPI00300C7983
MYAHHTQAGTAVPAPARRAPRIPAAIALVAVVAMAVAAWLAELPPAPAGAGAPPSEFSAQRAWPHLERIASGGPTPIGSAGGDAVRDHLVAELTRLGLRPEVQTGAGAHAFGGGVVAGLAENVVATIPGTASTGRVVLAAHYDSTPTTPGTSDDKASVAAILEIARALLTDRPPRNDVVLLLSDGEEPGMIGAEAFSAHPLGRGGGVMINLEGPGNAAPSAVYNVTPGGAGLVGAFARAMPYPVGESALVDAYRTTSFHSDLTVLEEDGWIGVDLGFAGGRAYYHHPRDTPAAFDPAALQMQGDNALAMVREVAAADLRELREPRDEAFFAAFGLVFRYTASLVTPLAVLAAAAVLAYAVLARLRGGPASGLAVTVPRLLLAPVLAAVPILAGVALATGLWPLLVAMEPGYGDLVSDPYVPGPYRLALIAMAVAVVWGWYVLLRRWSGSVTLTVGALFWQAVIGVAAAGLMPGASHYGSLTALAGAAGGCAALLLRERRPGLALVVQAVGAVPGMVLFTIGARSLGTPTGLAMAAPAAAFYVFAALSALPLLAAVTGTGSRPVRGRWWRVAAGPLVAGVLAVALVGVGVKANGFGQDRPRLAHLAYVLDAATGTGQWLSMNERPHPWAAEKAPNVPAAWDLPLPYQQVPPRTGPAPALDLAAPELTVLQERREGDTTVLRVRARSHRNAYQLNLHADARITGGTIEVPGQSPVPLPVSGQDREAWPFEVQFFAPPAGGVEFVLRVEGHGRPRMAVADVTLGLDGVPGHRPRPPGVDMTPSGGGLPTDSVTVVRVV